MLLMLWWPQPQNCLCCHFIIVILLLLWICKCLFIDSFAQGLTAYMLRTAGLRAWVNHSSQLDYFLFALKLTPTFISHYHLIIWGNNISICVFSWETFVTMSKSTAIAGIIWYLRPLHILYPSFLLSYVVFISVSLMYLSPFSYLITVASLWFLPIIHSGWLWLWAWWPPTHIFRRKLPENLQNANELRKKCDVRIGHKCGKPWFQEFGLGNWSRSRWSA